METTLAKALVESCVKYYSPKEASAYLIEFGVKYFGLSSCHSPDLWDEFLGRFYPSSDSIPMDGVTDWRSDLSREIVDSYEKVKRMFEVYSYIINTRLGQTLTWASQRETMTRWFRYALRGKLEKVLKFKTATLLALGLNQSELPPRPSCLEADDRANYLFQGKVGRRILHCTRIVSAKRDNGERVQFLYELYSAKRASLPVSSDFVTEALEKHWFTLTELDQKDLDNPFLDDLIEEVTRTVDELIPPVKCTPHYKVCPSFGASFKTGRDKGGSYSELVGESQLTSNEGHLGGFMQKSCPILVQESFDWKSEITSKPSKIGGGDVMGVEWRVPDVDEDWLDYVSVASQLQDIDCRPVALLEPFKVRVITRGSAPAYQLARAYQRIIAPLVGKNPAFRLTRGPAKMDHINDLLEKAQGPSAEYIEAFECGARRSTLEAEDYSSGTWRPEGIWVSGDYESATDLLNATLSEICLDRILHNLDAPYEHRRTLFGCLTRHTLHSADDSKVAPQINGQLMGSPLSFPILCMVNAAVTRKAIEVCTGRKKLLKDHAMLINGDDVLFHLRSIAEYEVWKTFTAGAGLKFSLGKNYVSRSYLVINSEIFKIRPHVNFFGERKWICDRSLPIINMGHVYVQKKSSSKLQSEQSMYGTHYLQKDSLKDSCEDFVEAHPLDKRCFALSKWISARKHELDTCLPKGMSYFVHESLGGLGLPVYPHKDQLVGITEGQRKLAAYLWTSQDPTARLINTGALRLPIPSFVERYMRDKSDLLQRLDVRYEWSNVKVKEDWPDFHRWTAVGIVGQDPPDMKPFRRVYEAVWRDAQASWASPLSFRKCIKGVFDGVPGYFGPAERVRKQ
ncbi:RNA-dependent RNA polymerase [Beihai narna-like virus 2]|uniref:RNA-dependent RNA polymerase n=1 Tax=Beihai narna-like virus 2 TaxID=1922447 RepID=UPI00090A8315|nr:RNA-dependent RNA polymerase [Beihai narna-like virus 2]APG77096.1 RNA-dependent RNA polymerase [Beihai narna-like virus 2]